MLITFTSAILIPPLIGYCILRGMRLRLESILLQICLSIGIGFGVSALIHFVVMFFTASQVLTIFIELAVCLLLIGVVQFSLTGPTGIALRPYQTTITYSMKRWANILTFVLVLISLLILVTFIIASMHNPHGGWDAWAIWNLRARFLYRSGVSWQLNYAAQNDWSHPDYPFFLPVTILRIWRFMGTETTFVPVFITLLFFFLTTATMYASLNFFRGKFWGAIGTLLLLGAPGFVLQGTSQYADIPLSFYFLLTWILLAACTQQGIAVAWALVGIAVGLSVLVKNEGLLFAALFFTAFFSLNSLRRTFTQKTISLAMIAGFLAVFAFALYFKHSLAPQNDLIAENSLVNVLQNLGNPSRYAQIGSTFRESATNLFNVPLIIFPLLWLFLGIDRQQFKQPVIGIALSTITFMILGYFFVYVTTPYDLEWHLKTSLSRLFAHLWPSLVFVSIMMIQELKKTE